jgi:hypothetical protein
VRELLACQASSQSRLISSRSGRIHSEMSRLSCITASAPASASSKSSFDSFDAGCPNAAATS